MVPIPVKVGFRVIVPSRPGYLRTPLTSGRTPGEQATLIAALLDTLGIERGALYAYSQGGASFAVRLGISRAVLGIDHVLSHNTPAART